MSERKNGKSTRSQDTSAADGRDRADGDDRDERDKDEFEASTGYQLSTN